MGTIQTGSSRRGRSVRRIIAPVTALALALAACGDTSDDGEVATEADEAGTSDEDTGTGADTAAQHPDAEEVEGPRPRVLVGDGESGEITVIDLESGEPVSTLDTDGFGALTTVGRHVFAADADNDLVTVIDGGSWSTEHGSHSHFYVADPRVVGTTNGSYPVHIVHGDDRVAVFYDDDGSADIHSDDDLESGDLEPVETVTTSGAHHGLVVPFEDHYVVSVPHDDPEELPTGIEVRHRPEEVEASFAEDCPGLHGEATFADGVLLACENGLLWVTDEAGGWNAELFDYPTHDGDSDVRVGSFAHDHGVPIAASHFDDESIVVTSLDGDPEMLLVELDEEVRDLALLGDDRVVVLTTDGRLQLIDATSGDLEAEVTVLGEDPLPADADWREPRRRLAVAGSHLLVSEPDEETVTEVVVDGDELAVDRTFDIDHMPEHLAVVGRG